MLIDEIKLNFADLVPMRRLMIIPIVGTAGFACVTLHLEVETMKRQRNHTWRGEKNLLFLEIFDCNFKAAHHTSAVRSIPRRQVKKILLTFTVHLATFIVHLDHQHSSYCSFILFIETNFLMDDELST